MDKRQQLPFIPTEVLMRIFEYLQLDDLKRCKLVCAKWNACISIADKGKYVFRSWVNSMEEINQRLSNLESTHLSIEFDSVDLKKLDFAAFGRKVIELRIVQCTSSPEGVEAMFMHTPNMKYLFCETSGDFDDVLNVFGHLKQRGFCNVNLETFICGGQLTRISHLYQMFPRLKNIGTLLDVTIDNNILFKCTGSSLEKLRYRYLILGFSPERLSPLSTLQLPKLKNFSVEFHLWSKALSAAAVTTFVEFLARLAELETLSLVFFEEVYFTETLLFRILQNCKKLKNLQVTAKNTSEKPVMNLLPGEYEKFLKLISNIESLDVFQICGDVFAFHEEIAKGNHLFTKLKSLAPEDFYLHPLNDLRTLLIFCSPNLEDLSLRVFDYKESFCPNLVQILNSHKNLRSLSVELVPVNSHSAVTVKHEKLERLEVKLPKDEVQDFLGLKRIMWVFPNLSVFHLTFYGNFELTATFNNFVVDWIKGLSPCLTEIKLPNNPYACMNIQNIAKICESKPRLKHIEWSSGDLPNTAEILDIFVNHCLELKKVFVHVYYRKDEDAETILYHYCRLKEKLFHSVRFDYD